MKFLKAFWLRLSSPSKAAVGVVLLMGFVGGLLFWAPSIQEWKRPTAKSFARAVTRRLWPKSKRRFTIQTVLGSRHLF